MLHHYVFEKCQLTCGQRKTECVSVNLALDIEDDDPFAPPAPKGKYHNGFACEGQLTLEWPTSVAYYLKKMLECSLVIFDQGDTTKLNILLVEQVGLEVSMPGALPGQPARMKRYTWTFACLQKPASDGLGLFPDAIKRQVMKCFIFTRFMGHWNSTQTSAVVVAQNRHQAIELLSRKMAEKGIAPLQEGGYSLVELDPTRPAAVIVTDGSD